MRCDAPLRTSADWGSGVVVLESVSAQVGIKMSRYEEVSVRGYDQFCKAVSERQGKDIFAYFSGDKDAEGRSWCPDCVRGEWV